MTFYRLHTRSDVLSTGTAGDDCSPIRVRMRIVLSDWLPDSTPARAWRIQAGEKLPPKLHAVVNICDTKTSWKLACRW
ncbi:MAG: hypothetical protein K6U74_19505 [Firmicutes bacterium]|nr:hypothetical protein [Bacillota bacterium]